jgi:hypothetical protein
LEGSIYRVYSIAFFLDRRQKCELKIQLDFAW